MSARSEKQEKRRLEKEAKRQRRNELSRKRREKERAKRYIPRLPRDKLHVIKNPEKDKGNWMESYDSQPKGASIARFPHPFKALFLGGCGRGKTNQLKNAFLQHQGGRGRKFRKLYIVTCSPLCSEYDDLEPDAIMTELPEADFFDGKQKTALIIDDFEMMTMNPSQKRRLSTLFRYVATHRNVSILCGFQSFFDTIPLIRKVSDVFVVYKPNNRQELTTLANRLNLETDDLKSIFKHICNKKYDSLCVNNIPGAKFRLTKNLHEPIVLEEDDDEQSDQSDISDSV